jgi:hypothetical protein
MSIPTWEEAAESEFWEKLPYDWHEQAVRDYLGSNGDAIDGRVHKLIGLAEKLYKDEHHASSVVSSVIALELMIQYFCVRPIVEGAILSALVSAEVSKRIIASRSSEQRKMLSAVLRPWGINLPELLLPDTRPLWASIENIVIKKRDGFVHRGDEVTDAEAELALQCVRSFREQVVLFLASRLGFTLEKTGRWSKIVDEPQLPGYLGGGRGYTVTDPFI